MASDAPGERSVARSPDAAAGPVKVGRHAAWALAVGGMVGGGMYTLAGVVVDLAGPWAWLSIVLGALIAIATVESYAHLTLATRSSGVPVTIFARDGRHGIANVLAWWLLAVYVLALAVYTFTAGHYLGNAVGLGRAGIVIAEAVMLAGLVVLNLAAVDNPVTVQVGAVWLQLVVLVVLAVIGLVHFDAARIGHGVTRGSPLGVLHGTVTTFIAFEGFEMIAYDLPELHRPRRILRRALPLAVIVVAVIYIAVTLGAASLVGGDTLVRHETAALAIAGRAVAGTPGMLVVTIAACVSALSAINATLFSAARLARTTAQHALLPRWCATCNRHDAPVWSTIAIGAGALAAAALIELQLLVAISSIGFLVLFAIVNVMALQRWWARVSRRRSNVLSS